MLGYLKRLATTGAAYQAADVVSRVFALVTLPLYLHHVSSADYGVAEVVVTAVVLVSIPLRLGLGEAFVRFWYLDDDDERRRRLGRSTTATVFWVTTIAFLVALPFAGPLSQALLGDRDAVVLGFGLLGLWAFANLEVAKALLRVEERWRAFLVATVGNVTLTVLLTVVLVVVRDDGARGLVAGSSVASPGTVVALWFALRRYVGFVPSMAARRPLLGFGLPTIPADAAAFALNVVDRAYILRADSPGAAGQYALAAKLSTVVIVAVRGFQAAWPPLAYSMTDEEQAARLYARVTTAYVVVTGLVVCGVALVARYAVHLLAGDPSFYPAQDALPWVALGWAMYGLVVLLITVAGRAKITTRNFPATLAGLVTNVVLLVTLVGPLGITGAGIALAGAYVVILIVLHLLTRGLFHVPFEARRLTATVVSLTAWTVAGVLLLPETGAVGLVSRLAWLAAAPLLLVVVRVITPTELRALARMRAASSA